MIIVENAIGRQDRETVDWSIPLVGRKQLADHFGFSTRWVSQQVANGAPHFRMGGSLRFQIPVFADWLMEQESQ